MLGSPGGAVFASPAAYSGHPFGAGGMLSPEAFPHVGAFPSSPYGTAQPAPAYRHSSMASTVSPLTPVALSTLASPFFPSSAPPIRSPPASLASTPRPHLQPHQSEPSRRTTLHASAPSFHLARDSPRSFFPWSAPSPRGHGKRESVSVSALRVGDDPQRSPTLSRATSASPATSTRRDEPRRKKVVVCLPREGTSSDDEREGFGALLGRPRSAMRRAPLSAQERDEVETRSEAASGAVEAASRAQHEDEVKPAELPPAIDVYLPGKDAWEEVWDQFEEEMMEKHGRCVRLPFPLEPLVHRRVLTIASNCAQDVRRPAFLPSSAPPSLDNLFPRRPGHGRTASLFASPSAQLPPRLQSVFDPICRVGGGHARSLSLSLPAGLTALRTSPSTTLRSPALTSLSPSPAPPASLAQARMTSSSRLTPHAESFVPSSPATSLQAAAATALPRSPPSSPEAAAPVVHARPHDAQVEHGLVAPARRRPSEEDDKVVETGALAAVEPVAPVPVAVASRGVIDATEFDNEHGDGRRTAPSRSASGVSTRTDHTGVASLSGSAHSWTDASEEEDKASGSARAGPGCAPALSHELSRALTDLGSLEAHEADDALRPGESDGSAVGVNVDASDDSQYGDGELSAGEHSNDEAARALAPRRADRTAPSRQSIVSTTDDEDDKPLAMLALRPPASPLFQAPSDVDRPDVELSTAYAPQHKVNAAFSFPPRSSAASPAKLRRTAADVVLPDSSSASSARASPQLELLDYGDPAPSALVAPPSQRRASKASSVPSSSPIVAAFGPFGEPGSLAVSPSALPDTPSAPQVDRPFAQPASRTPTSSMSSTRSPLKATAVEFKPSPASSLPPSFGTSGTSSFDFHPPSDAPTLPVVAAPASPHAPTRHVSGSHGPLPPIPLTTVTPHSSALKRRKGDDGDWLPAIESSSTQHLVSSPLLAHPQPRRPLPDPPSAFEQDTSLEGDLGDVEVLRDEGGDTAGQEDSGSRSFMSSLSVDDPLPEQYAPARPIGAKRPAAPEAASSRPFALRAAPHLSADGRLVGFNRAGSPDGGVSSFGPHEHEVQVSPARMGDPRATREDSVDIALPSSLRAKSKAIPLSAARLKVRSLFLPALFSYSLNFTDERFFTGERHLRRHVRRPRLARKLDRPQRFVVKRHRGRRGRPAAAHPRGPHFGPLRLAQGRAPGGARPEPTRPRAPRRLDHVPPRDGPRRAPPARSRRRPRGRPQA